MMLTWPADYRSSRAECVVFLDFNYRISIMLCSRVFKATLKAITDSSDSMCNSKLYLH